MPSKIKVGGRIDGRPPFRAGWWAREPGSMLRLALSESSVAASPAVFEAMVRESERLHLYPDSDAEPLRSLIAEKWGVTAEQVVVTNGADEALLLAVLSLTSPGELGVTTARTFAGYTASFALASVKPRLIPVAEDGVDAAAFSDGMHGAALAILCNPHNPTGGCLSASEVEHIVRRARDHGTLLIVDEAYGEFADPAAFHTAWPNRPASYDHVVVVRSFSKAYALAGLRCGYAIASRPVADRIHAARAALPYNVNRLALAAAAAVLTDEAHLRHTVEANARARELMRTVLARHGIRTARSQTNFVLARLGPATAHVVDELATRHAIAVRDAAGLGFPGWARIGVSTPETVVDVAEKIVRVLRTPGPLREHGRSHTVAGHDLGEPWPATDFLTGGDASGGADR